MTDDEIVNLAPLRRGGQCGYWQPAPRSHGLKIYRDVVYRLVNEGRLSWGNRCRSFVCRIPIAESQPSMMRKRE